MPGKITLQLRVSTANSQSASKWKPGFVQLPLVHARTSMSVLGLIGRH
ncbi:hypothetical protein ACU8KH_06506 [Lachancea thermotolerans]